MSLSREERTQKLIEDGKKTRFGQPGGNKPGLTSERARLMLEAQEKAARIQDKLLDAIELQLNDAIDLIKGGTVDALDIADRVNKSTTISLIKMIQDRELGTPRQSLDLSNSDGSFTPPVINIGFMPGSSDESSDNS